MPVNTSVSTPVPRMKARVVYGGQEISLGLHRDLDAVRAAYYRWLGTKPPGSVPADLIPQVIALH